ncbi:hypothetical protein ACFPTO_02185 [Paraburkholderia denitrificans]|uniref:Uncharacterized protein n=1 Tax=Paraburkholderia denitrificans TaxID=694025 RepID=A0ABW0J3M1_9BURK
MDVAFGIKRKQALEASNMTLADVVLRSHPDFPDLTVFHCSALNADISASACASNFTKGQYVACKGCEVGAFHCGKDAIAKMRRARDRHQLHEETQGMTCVRCLRSGRTDTTHIGRFRIIPSAMLCVGCYNRSREVARGGLNSKGAPCKKWAHLRQATATIELEDGTWQTLDLGFRTGRPECERFVSQAHPGAKLVEVFIDGRAVQPGEGKPERKIAGRKDAWSAAKPKAEPKKRKGKPRPVASDDGLDEFGDRVPMQFKKPNGRTTWGPALSEDSDAAYRASFDKPEPLDVDTLGTLPWDGLDTISDYWDSTAMLVRYLLRDDTTTKQPIADRDDSELTWGGKTLAHWSEVTGVPVDVLAGRMVAHGSPFSEGRASIQKCPDPTHSVAVWSTGVSAPSVQNSIPEIPVNESKQWVSESSAIKDTPLEPAQALVVAVGQSIKARRKRIDAGRIGHPNAEDLTGKRFEFLKVLHRDGVTPFSRAKWRVVCDCGTETVVRASDLKEGKQVSCGCFAKSTIRQRVRQKGPITEQERAEWSEIVGRDSAPAIALACQPQETVLASGPKRPRNGKALRRMEKTRRRAEREQQANSAKLNTKATDAAIGSRALVLAFRCGVADIIAPRS